jgi:hypothetical protein
MKEIILSSLSGGIIGAFIATILTILYQHLMERMRLKADATLFVMQRVDAVLAHFLMIHSDKDVAVKVGKVTEGEIVEQTIRNLLTMLFSEEARNRIYLVFGEGEILDTYNSLHKLFWKFYQLVFEGTKDSWAEQCPKVSSLMNDEILPLSHTLGDRLRKNSSMPLIWSQFKHDFSKHPGWGTIGETLKRMAQ